MESKQEPKQRFFFHTSTYKDSNGHLQVTKIPVVQELARLGEPNIIPLSFKLPENQQVITSSSEAHLPIISLTRLGDRTDQEAELVKLRRGVEEWGMFLITDHGIDSRTVENVKEVVKGFFELSYEAKKESVGTRDSVHNMGYGRNFLKFGKPVDWIDRLTMAAAPAEAVDTTVWPLKPSHFRKVIETYVVEAREVLDETLKYLEQAFGLRNETFTQYFDRAKSTINVRINYYPPCPSPESVLGLTSHSDISTLTLLMESEASGGLQVMSGESSNWLTVSWPKDMLLVGAGDLLEIMSNGLIHSPWHRVVTHKSVDRFSVALFYNPAAEVEVEPVTVSGDGEEGAAKYRNIVVKEYLQHYYDIAPTPDKQAIKYAKLHP